MVFAYGGTYKYSIDCLKYYPSSPQPNKGNHSFITSRYRISLTQRDIYNSLHCSVRVKIIVGINEASHSTNETPILEFFVSYETLEPHWSEFRASLLRHYFLNANVAVLKWPIKLSVHVRHHMNDYLFTGITMSSLTIWRKIQR